MKDYAKVKEHLLKRINGNIIRKDILIEKVESRFGKDAAIYAERYLNYKSSWELPIPTNRIFS